MPPNLAEGELAPVTAIFPVVPQDLPAFHNEIHFLKGQRIEQGICCPAINAETGCGPAPRPGADPATAIPIVLLVMDPLFKIIFPGFRL